MPPPALLFDEAAAIDALKAFVVGALPAVAAVDVYRARPTSSPRASGLSVVLTPTTPLPVLSSPTGEESDGAQRQRVTVTVAAPAAGAWTFHLLGQDAAYVAGGGPTVTDVRDGLRAAVDALGLAVVTANLPAPAMGQAAFSVLADTAGVSMVPTLMAVPAGGAGSVTIVDDSIRRCVYNWGTWTIRAVIRGTEPITGAAAPAVGPLAEMLRMRMQGSSVPITAGLAYPYERDRLQGDGKMRWRVTRGPFSADVVEGGVWHRGVALDFVFDVTVGLLHDVPSMDSVHTTTFGADL